ncbi:3'-5' exoribonuclease [Streptococcus mutans]|nr:3'-5' exoribonuclease [Streptococcus mutans]MCB5007559.1 3'-5' exoribonuclease [Streptococcus mutans]MCB5030035.1 3'-5' exoribonuclease [Streptococcus mutans]MCB5082307.1 3'-5' exoribonuclease [Streptococcus mutans]MCB5100707.1 3'-5' exoribonuclease [Streptococcus mutans]
MNEKQLGRNAHIMVDIETLGTAVNATVFQIAAVRFDINTGEILAEFNETQDIAELSNINADGSTIQWWLETNSDLMKYLICLPTTSKLLADFHAWLTAQSEDFDLYLWGNGILFDNNIIRQQFVDMGLNYPIRYSHDRDVRTILQLACDKLDTTVNEFKQQCYDPSLTQHHAYHDVINQVAAVVTAYNLLTGGE